MKIVVCVDVTPVVVGSSYYHTDFLSSAVIQVLSPTLSWLHMYLTSQKSTVSTSNEQLKGTEEKCSNHLGAMLAICQSGKSITNSFYSVYQKLLCVKWPYLLILLVSMSTNVRVLLLIILHQCVVRSHIFQIFSACAPCALDWILMSIFCNSLLPNLQRPTALRLDSKDMGGASKTNG